MRACTLTIISLAWGALACPYQGAPCQSSSDCIKSEVCAERKCRKACAVGKDCAADERCIEGACLPLRYVDAATDAGRTDLGSPDLRGDGAALYDRNILDSGGEDLLCRDILCHDIVLHDLWRQDGERQDANAEDLRRPDTQLLPDRIRPDSNPVDSGTADLARPDTSLPDNTIPDTPVLDHALFDSGAPDLPRPDVAPGNWWDTAWRARYPITLSTAGHSGSYRNVPVLVTLHVTTFDYSASDPDGGDLRFVLDGASETLSHEIDTWDRSGTSRIWLLVPLLQDSQDDTVYLYLDNPGAAPAGPGSDVWSSGHVGVWHLGEPNGSSTTQHLDSTNNGNHAVGYGNTAAVGTIGHGQSLDGVDDYIELPPTVLTNMTNMTFSAWVWFEGTTPWQRVFDFGDGPATPTTGHYVFFCPLRQGVNNSATVSFTLGGYTNNQAVAALAPMTRESWVHLAVVLDSGQVGIFFDGNLVGEGDVTISLAEIGSVRHWLGRSQYAADPTFDGVFDEVRLERVAHSPGWIAVQASMLRDNFAAIGAVERLD